MTERDRPLPRGRRVAIVGNSDAIGLLASNAASAVTSTMATSSSLRAAIAASA